jgi:hypothetical protein
MNSPKSRQGSGNSFITTAPTLSRGHQLADEVEQLHR